MLLYPTLYQPYHPLYPLTRCIDELNYLNEFASSRCAELSRRERQLKEERLRYENAEIKCNIQRGKARETEEGMAAKDQETNLN